MKSRNPVLPADAIAALEQGNSIEAIKIIREKTGLGLKESKDILDAYIAGSPQRSTPGNSGSIPPEAISLLELGDLIGAIKATRAGTGMGLKDSKAAVEMFLDANPSTQQRFKSVAARERNSAVLAIFATALVSLAIYAVLKWLKVI